MRSKNPEALKNNPPLGDVHPIPVKRGETSGFVAVTTTGYQEFFTTKQYMALTQSRRMDQNIPTIPAQEVIRTQVHIPTVAEMRKSYQEYLEQINEPKNADISAKKAS